MIKRKRCPEAETLEKKKQTKLEREGGREEQRERQTKKQKGDKGGETERQTQRQKMMGEGDGGLDSTDTAEPCYLAWHGAEKKQFPINSID